MLEARHAAKKLPKSAHVASVAGLESVDRQRNGRAPPFVIYEIR